MSETRNMERDDKTRMQGLFVEQRNLHGNASLSWDIAHHMYARQLRGGIAIVAEQPGVLLVSVKKQWRKLIRQVQDERGTTIDATKIVELTREIAWMQNIRFTAEPPKHDPLAEVMFATASQYIETPPTCHTLYVTHPVDRVQLHMLVSWMPARGLVVTY